MKLQIKILILLSVIFGAVISTFIGYQYIRIEERKVFFQENRRNQELIIDKVIQIGQAKCYQLINDNSSWDDMITFVAKPDFEWAKSNVDFFVNSFNMAFVIAYNKQKELVYEFGDSLCLRNLEYPSEEVIQADFASSPYTRYFQYAGSQLIEIYGAIVVPASDADARRTPAQGYLFTAKKWDQDYINELMDATGYDVKLLNHSEAEPIKNDPAKIYFVKDLKDNSGKVIARLVFSKPDLLSLDLNPLVNMTILASFISVIAMLVFLFFFRRIILIPILKISKTLNTNNPEYIQSLNKNTDEFKILQNLILDFFGQQDLLRSNNLQLQENNATKDKLFSIIAHDLRNPVGNIKNISELLIDSLKKQNMKDSDELLQMIGAQSKETLALLETLFEWAKSQTGQLNYSPDVMELTWVVNQIIDIQNPTAVLKGIGLENRIGKEILVFADPNMLKSILRNLITNAIKFTHPGGGITISAKQSDDFVEIAVSDTGVGMSEEVKEKLFKINTNITTAGTANERGTGLGLIICKEFIEKHGGKIWIESELAVGTTITFTIPVYQAERDADAEELDNSAI
jgi:signal transduction histidine kinase